MCRAPKLHGWRAPCTSNTHTNTRACTHTQLHAHKYTRSHAHARTQAHARLRASRRVGPDAPEIIQGIAIAVKGHATKKQFDSTVGVHPSGPFLAQAAPTLHAHLSCATPQLRTAGCYMPQAVPCPKLLHAPGATAGSSSGRELQGRTPIIESGCQLWAPMMHSKKRSIFCTRGRGCARCRVRGHTDNMAGSTVGRVCGWCSVLRFKSGSRCIVGAAAE